MNIVLLLIYYYQSVLCILSHKKLLVTDDAWKMIKLQDHLTQEALGSN